VLVRSSVVKLFPSRSISTSSVRV
jgi:hypothetical protein